jgi:hypothetical protein
VVETPVYGHKLLVGVVGLTLVGVVEVVGIIMQLTTEEPEVLE